METLQKSVRIWRFGVFEVDARSIELRRNGVTVRIREQSLRVLICLLEHAGELVTREDLRRVLWPADTFVDFDHSLNTAMMKLRDALGDVADAPVYIETIPRRGYRFVAPVSVAISQQDGVASANGEAAGRPNDGQLHPEQAEQAASHRRFAPWAMAGLVIAGLALLVAFNVGGVLDRLHRKPAAAPPIRSLAVLPLENLSGDPEQEYFADGMTEELTTELAQISALKVISHTSAVQYKGTKKSLPQIAKELGIDAVVEGAVERSGEKVRITVQLIQAPSDRHLWAESYERDLSNVVELQREVTHTIVNEIEAKLTEPEKVHLANAPSIESQPYDNYLRGRFSLENGDLNKSVAYFQQAIQEKPDYALAYAGLANAYISMGQPWNSDLSPGEVLPQARAAARRALELDSSIGDTHLAMARVVQLYDWDWVVVEREYRRALQLNQNDALAHAWFGEYLQEMGRSEEALAEYRHAAELDPLNAAESEVESGFVLYTSRQYDDAIPLFRKALALESENESAHVGLGWVYQKKRMFPEAIAELEKAVDLGKGHELSLASLGQVLAESGRRRDAQNVLSELKRRSQHRYVSPCLFALVQTGLGERDQAIASLEQGYTNRDQWMLYLKVDPHMDELRSDPRFRDLVRRVGIPE